MKKIRGVKNKVSLNVRLKNKINHFLCMYKIIGSYFFKFVINLLYINILLLRKNHFSIQLKKTFFMVKKYQK